ncbi:ketol-acid reductoisomerase [Buchnera aphidicola]|uniref:Ketol-acid reductoisomerase n=1 Tax=Buchnera aphidicola (Anoecia oenotherae) TaxID=1241833 RepID=A0A4D6XVL1_9GAMM|nr:ketol-acid reductoisomerase [Buchnera aphidicola]QCI19567.1 ketol-acid reductoisomerase [Buchnera aphidicola (Anoecia oenotherae)]
MSNYFNKLCFRKKLIEIKKSKFINSSDFLNGVNFLKNKKIVIIGCGSQGLNQGLNMRDSGLDVSFALRNETIEKKGVSWKNAIQNEFLALDYESIIPFADVVINLTPDREHSEVVKKILPMMKSGSFLGYSHGFNIVEVGEKIREDITVIMVAPKCPGTEVRAEFLRGFGVPALIAVHTNNDIKKEGMYAAKAWAVSIGSHRAGVLESSFIAEVKSDLMGEQTILCGVLQSASISFFEKLISSGINENYAVNLIQNGWEKITETLKQGGIWLMLDRLSSSAKIEACKLSNKLKNMFSPLYRKHMDDIISGKFSEKVISDWKNNNQDLIYLRRENKNSDFEKAKKSETVLLDQEYFDNGIVMVAILKAGIELSFEIMLESGISAESAYYESLHELPLIANTVARKRLYEMNLVISDTAEYGNYLFTREALPIFRSFMSSLNINKLNQLVKKNIVNNVELNELNRKIYNHPIEVIGRKLRIYMKHTQNYSKVVIKK